MATTLILDSNSMRQDTGARHAAPVAGAAGRSAGLVPPDALAQADFSAYRAEARRLRAQAHSEVFTAAVAWLRGLVKTA